MTFNLTATEAIGPRIAAGGVAGVAGSIPPVRQISPNGLVSIYGEQFAPAGTARAVGAGDLVNGRVPTKFAGVCVQVGGQSASVLYVSPSQLNIQIPSLTGAGEISVQVVRNCGEANELKSSVEKVTLQAATPEFLYFLRNADGKNPVAATNAVTYEYIGAPGLIPGANFVPAKPNDLLTFYATGFGLTNPAFEAGQLPDQVAPTVEKVRVTLGGGTRGCGRALRWGIAGPGWGLPDQPAGACRLARRRPRGGGPGRELYVPTRRVPDGEAVGRGRLTGRCVAAPPAGRAPFRLGCPGVAMAAWTAGLPSWHTEEGGPRRGKPHDRHQRAFRW